MNMKLKQLKCKRLNALLIISALALSTLPAKAWTPATYAGTKPSFQEEFNGTKMDKTKWNTTTYWGGRNNPGTGEVQYYVDDAFTFANGAIKIKADNKPTQGYPYTSGLLTTYGKFTQQYGYFEMRAKVPKGKGLWPAFWLLPQNQAWPPEIDAMETLGNQPNTVFLTQHFVGKSGQPDSSGDFYTGPDYTLSYHTFGVDWRPTSITWYVDGIKRHEVKTNIPKEKMYIIANLAVGGDWPGLPDTTTPFPSYLTIDYIRAYPYSGS
jgi:beta-glucanase (GH16 family)